MSSAGRLEGDLAPLNGRKGPLQLYVRPDAVQLLPASEAAPASGAFSLPGAKVVDALYSGGEIDYVLEVGGVTFYVSTHSARATFNQGDTVRLVFTHRDSLIYSEDKLVAV